MDAAASDPKPGRVLAEDVLALPLTERSHAGVWIEGGWPVASTKVLGHVASNRIAVWEVTGGVVADIENDELILILAGSGRLRFEDGENVELHPGTCVRLHAAERTEWTVLTTMRALTITQQ
jgi:uncharacterized protein